MGCRALFVDGVDIDIYFADYVGTCAGAGTLVYLGGWTFIQFGRDILPLAEIKVFACDMAFIRNRRNSVFFLCRTVRRNFGCIVVDFSIRLEYNVFVMKRIWFIFTTTTTTTTPAGVR